MRTGQQIAGLLPVLLATACPAPVQLRALPTLTVLPVGDALYRLAEDEGFDDIDFALRVEGPGSGLDIDEMQLDLTVGGVLAWEQRMLRAAVQAHLVRGRSGPGLNQYENFHLTFPSSLEVDGLRVQLRRDGGTVATQDVPVRRYQQIHRFHLPVQGCWFVSAGHEFGAEHRRWYTRSHFAWDLMMLDDADGLQQGKTELAQYRAFGRTVLAPADGTVVLARDDFPDNPPGIVGAPEASNFLLLDHGAGEFSKLAHLRQGSLRVSPGQRVQAGQVLAQVGNSGRSDAPHLHLHFQRTTLDGDGRVLDEQPVPVALSDYLSTSNRGVGVRVDQG
ncbi:MAG: M23 family metallopeptidase, partial [Pseudomonadota bacterium]